MASTDIPALDYFQLRVVFLSAYELGPYVLS